MFQSHHCLWEWSKKENPIKETSHFFNKENVIANHHTFTAPHPERKPTKGCSPLPPQVMMKWPNHDMARNEVLVLSAEPGAHFTLHIQKFGEEDFPLWITWSCWSCNFQSRNSTQCYPNPHHINIWSHRFCCKFARNKNNPEILQKSTHPHGPSRPGTV